MRTLWEWLTRAPPRDQLTSGAPIAWWMLVPSALALLAYGSLVASRLCSIRYAVANLVAVGVGLVLAGARGFGATQTGLDARRLGRSVSVGAAFAALAFPLIVVGGPPIAERVGPSFLSDCPTLDLGLEVARIAIGTALAEEVLFRGLLLGAVARGRSVGRGLLWSSLAFGLWHVGPNLDDIGGIDSLFSATALPLLLHLGITFLAALLVLGPMRLRTGNVAASVIAHATVNTSVVLALRL